MLSWSFNYRVVESLVPVFHIPWILRSLQARVDGVLDGSPLAPLQLYSILCWCALGKTSALANAMVPFPSIGGVCVTCTGALPLTSRNLQPHIWSSTSCTLHLPAYLSHRLYSVFFSPALGHSLDSATLEVSVGAIRGVRTVGPRLEATISEPSSPRENSSSISFFGRDRKALTGV